MANDWPGVASRTEPPGPSPAGATRELPEEIRSLGCVRDGEGEAGVELCFIAGCAGGFTYEKACDRPDMLSQPLLHARQRPGAQCATGLVWTAPGAEAADAIAAAELGAALMMSWKRASALS